MKQKLLFIMDGHPPVEIECRTFKAAIIMLATNTEMYDIALFCKCLAGYDEVNDRSEIIHLYNLFSCYPSITSVYLIADTIFNPEVEE